MDNSGLPPTPNPPTNPLPEPLAVQVCYTPDLRWTAIARRWHPGDSGPQGACRRCVVCHAFRDGCLMTVPGILSRAEAAIFSPSLAGIRLTSIRPIGPRPPPRA